MKKINIDDLSYEELIDLNHRIVDRLKRIDAVGDLMQVLGFKIGEEVEFVEKNGTTIMGIVTKLNKKTVSVTTKEGQRWNVSPRLLKRKEEKRDGISGRNNLIDLKDHTASQ